VTNWPDYDAALVRRGSLTLRVTKAALPPDMHQRRSKLLAQWRAAGRWPACYDELWARLNKRHGKQNGIRAMIAVPGLGQVFGHDQLRAGVAHCYDLGSWYQ